MANLQPSGSLISDAWSIKLIFSLIVTFYLTKTQNRTKTIALSKGTVFAKKMLIFLQKNADISKIKGVLVLKGRISKSTYKCLLSYQISSF